MDDPQGLGWMQQPDGSWWNPITGEIIAAPAPNAAPLVYNPPPAQDPELTTYNPTPWVAPAPARPAPATGAPVDPYAGSGGVYNNFGAQGNDWSIIHGKVYNWKGAQLPPEVAGYPQATQQEMSQAMDPNGPGNGEGGSDFANIMKVLGFVGGGAALTGGLGGSALGADTTAFEAGGAGGLQSWGGAEAGASGLGGTSFMNPDGSFGSTLANSANGGPGMVQPIGSASGYTPWTTGEIATGAGNTMGATNSFMNPDGSFGSTLANSNPGGYGVVDSLGAASGYTPWMTDPGILGGLSSAFSGLSGLGSVGSALGLGGSGSSAGGSNNSLIGALLGGILGSQNGAKQAGTTTTVSDIPDWLKPYATNLLNQGQGQVNANAVNPGTFAGSDATLNNIMNGGSIQAPTFNPYGGSTTPQTSNGYIGQNTAPTSNGYIGATTPQTSNSYIGATATPGTSQYLGMDNPYFQGVLDKALNDTQGRVNNQFRNSAFGGSANQELLARNLGDQANSMRYGEYGNQVQLSEADIARKLQAEQTDLARNSSLAQNQGQFNAGLTQADLARNSSLLQNQGQFNANLSQTDLARNASLQQNQGQFNANLYANDLTRNGNLWNSDATRNQNAFQFGQGQAFNAATNMPQYTSNKTAAAFAPLTAQKGLFTSGTQTSTPYYTNPAAGLLGGALAGSQLFGGGGGDRDTQEMKRNAWAGSDVRIKENIVRIGSLPSGLNVYEFDYKPEYRDAWGHERRVGVMAQEVMTTNPRAVEVHPNGYLMVDYGQLFGGK